MNHCQRFERPLICWLLCSGGTRSSHCILSGPALVFGSGLVVHSLEKKCWGTGLHSWPWTWHTGVYFNHATWRRRKEIKKNNFLLKSSVGCDTQEEGTNMGAEAGGWTWLLSVVVVGGRGEGVLVHLQRAMRTGSKTQNNILYPPLALHLHPPLFPAKRCFVAVSSHRASHQ